MLAGTGYEKLNVPKKGGGLLEASNDEIQEGRRSGESFLFADFVVFFRTHPAFGNMCGMAGELAVG